MTDLPLVSVIIPAYNAAWCVEKAVDSALAQTHPRLEVIVVDDGSQDTTPQVLARYGERIRLIHQPNRGQSNARNTGIRAAKGTFLAFLDADDWWEPEKIERQLAPLLQAPGLGFTSTAAVVEDPAGRVLAQWRCPRIEGPLLEHLFEHHAAVAGGCSSVLMRRELFERVAPFDESLQGFEDPDLWIRLAAVSGYACIDEPLVHILRRPGSVSAHLDGMRRSAIRSMYKNRTLLPPQRRGAFWRHCLAGVHLDYAKWEWRTGLRRAALADVLHALRLAPLRRGRLCLGLLRDMALGHPL